jgi:hypothetical protein
MVNYTTMWPFWAIYEPFTVLGHETAHKYLLVAVQIIRVVTVLEDVVGIIRIDLTIKAAISLFMDIFDQAPFILLMMQAPTLLTLC